MLWNNNEGLKGENLTKCEVFILWNAYYFLLNEICRLKERSELLWRIYKAFWGRVKRGLYDSCRGINIEKRYLIGKSDQIFPCIYTLLFHLPRKTGKNLHHLMMLLELGRGGGGRVWVLVVMKLNPGVYDTKDSSLNLKCFLLVFVA